jgi:Cysteine sulfinate desulfinase/cysteine desulfurase and related enzymes
MKRIYLDYHASTPVDPRVVEKVNEVMVLPGNPHSSHLDGSDALDIIDDAKEYLVDAFEVFEDELFFTSGATESNNLAILGALERFQSIDSKRNKVFVSYLEHKSVLEPIERECERLGLQLVFVPVTKEGFFDVSFLEDRIDEKTLFVSLCGVNGEIGTVQPLREVGNLCEKSGVVFHVDATQAVYEFLKPADLGIHLMSMSSHKIYGPMGVGLLYVDSSMSFDLKPLMFGGGQQLGIRSGTIPVHQVAGFVEALRIIYDDPSEKEALAERRDFMYKLLIEHMPAIKANGSLKKRHPGNLSIQFLGVDGRVLVNNVKNKLSISTGSACSSGVIKPSSVLKAIGLSDDEANSTVRVSIGRFTRDENLVSAVATLKMQYDALIDSSGLVL